MHWFDRDEIFDKTLRFSKMAMVLYIKSECKFGKFDIIDFVFVDVTQK